MLRWVRAHPVESSALGAGLALAAFLAATRDGGAMPKPEGWSFLTDSTIWLSPGWRYRAVVALPWYVPSAIATPAKAKSYAEGKGFTDVEAFASIPPGWPPTKGDLWVEATWSGIGQYYERPGTLTYVWVKI